MSENKLHENLGIFSINQESWKEDFVDLVVKDKIEIT